MADEEKDKKKHEGDRKPRERGVTTFKQPGGNPKTSSAGPPPTLNREFYKEN